MDPYALLRPEDKTFAQTTGIKVEAAPDLFIVGAQGQLAWTAKGVQFLRYACEAHGLRCALDTIQTQKQLIALVLDMNSVRLARLREATARSVRRGSVAPVERDFTKAVLAGSLDDVLDAADRHQECAKAGPNVLPGRFGSGTPT